ncbi:MAG TPA: nuclear transport factor 2 family protein [Candidatus Angelobacter sp.]|nr:nuclear transport factor 2 family protein [Candidatus Angelobacter sp.]
MITRDAARRWADTWRVAWEALDPEPIVALYAPGAVFSSEPFREAVVGPSGVRAYVARVFAEEDAPRVWTSEPIVDGDRAAITWWAALGEDGEDATLAGTSVLRFDGDGLVVQQWDAWNAAPGRREPTSGTPVTDPDA